MSQDDSNPSGVKSEQSPIGIGLVIVLILVVVGISWGLGEKLQPIPQTPRIDAPINPTIAPEKEAAKVSPPEKKEPTPATKSEAVPAKPEKRAGMVPARPKPQTSAVQDPYKIRNLTLKNVDGKVIYRGDMDLGPEIRRIKEGEKLPFSHDGGVFQNRESRLPKKGEGYYREWVVLTPGQSGPGPQRIITGKSGEMYYTSDHYRTFQKLP